MARRTASVFVAFVGGALVVAAVQVALLPDVAVYRHSIEPVNGDRSVDGFDVEATYQFEDISPEGKAAVRAAFDAPDSEALVYGAEDRLPEFKYADDNQITYAVERGNATYRLTTLYAGPSGLGALSYYIPAFLLAVAGLLLVLLAPSLADTVREQRSVLLGAAIAVALFWYGDRPLGTERLPTALAAGVAAYLAIVALTWLVEPLLSRRNGGKTPGDP
jgi:hypothetical protein